MRHEISGPFYHTFCYKRGEDYRLFYWTYWGLRFQRIFNIGVALKVALGAESRKLRRRVLSFHFLIWKILVH